MYDVIAGEAVGLAGVLVRSGEPVVQVTSHVEVDLEPYGDAELSDEQLLAHARMELQTAQLERTRGQRRGEAGPGPVLGSYRRPMIDALDEVLAGFDTQVDVYADLTDTVLLGTWPARNELEVRRERRTTARVLRNAIGGVA